MSDQYQITDKASGMVMTIEGDRPPTQKESKKLFSRFKEGPQLKQNPTTWDKVKADLFAPPKTMGDALSKAANMGGITTAVGDVAKAALPSLFNEEGTTLQPDVPRGIVPKIGKVLSSSALDRLLPEKEVTKDDSVVEAMAKEGYNIATGIPKFMASPAAASLAVGGEAVGASAEARAMEQFAGSGEQALSRLATIARNAAVRKYGQAVTAYFSADMAKGAAQGVADLYHNHQNMTWGQTAAAMEGIVSSALFSGWLGKKGFTTGEKTRKPPEPPSGAETAAAPPAEPPASSPAAPKEPSDQEIEQRLSEIADLRKNGGFAGQTREEKRLLKMQSDRATKAKATEQASFERDQEKHGHLQEELHSMMEGGLPDADIERTKQQIKDLQDRWGDRLVPPELSPEAKALLAEHGKGLNIVTDDQAGQPEAPFAKGYGESGAPAWATSGGRIVIHRRNFQDWLNSIPPEKRSQAAQSLLSEEAIHTHTTPEDAAEYWKHLTGFEKWAMKYRYDPDGTKVPHYTDAHWGAEAIRYHLQRMMRMTPTEIAQEYGEKDSTLHRAKLKALDVIDGIVRRARQAITGGPGKAILDRVQQNLETAKNALSGNVVETEPAAYAEQASKNANDLKAQADEYRKQGMEAEAKEMEDMATQAAEWAKTEVEPQASGRRKDSKDQGTFEDLMNRSRWESARAMINEGRQAELLAKSRKQLFKMAQQESGQPPTFEPGAAGRRGRPKKEGPSYREGEEMFPKGVTLSRPESTAVQLPGGKAAVVGGRAVTLQPGETPEELPAVPAEERQLSEKQAPKLPTGLEIEGAAQKWVSDEFASAAENKGKKGVGLPDIKEYEKYMERNYHVKPGQARQLYADAMVKHLKSASGEQLQSLLQAAFGPGSIIGRTRVPDAPEGRRSGFQLESPDSTAEARKKEEQKDRATSDPISGRKIGRPELTTAEAMQQRRQKAVALLYNKAMAVSTSEDPGLLSRKNLLPSEIRTSPKFGTGGVIALSKMDSSDPELEDLLYNDSRRSGRDKASVTRRVLVLRRRSDNSVHQVSVWRNPASKRMFITNPDLPQGEGLALTDALNRYGLIETYSLDQPVEKFHRRFGSLGEYNDKFGKEARELSQAAGEYDPSETPEGQFVSSTAPTVIGENQEGNIGPVHLTEGINEGGTGSFMGPDKAEATALMGAGESSFTQSIHGRITDQEARAVAKAFGRANTVEDAKKILKGLGQEAFAKAKAKWRAADDRVKRAQEAVSRAETERTTAPEDYQVEKEAPEVAEARKRLRAATQEAARATGELAQEAALRSGVAKIAHRYQRVYGTRVEHDSAGKEFPSQVPTEDLLHSMAKSIFSASLKGVLRPDPLSGIKSLGGDKPQVSPWDRPQTPSGRELSMVNRRAPTDVKPENLPPGYQASPKVPPPADAMTPAPIKPVETLDGKAFQQIEHSTMTEERRRKLSMNIVDFTPEEKAEIAQAQKIANNKRRAARSASKARQQESTPQKLSYTLGQWRSIHGLEEGVEKRGKKTQPDPKQESLSFTGPQRDVELPRPPEPDPKQESLSFTGPQRDVELPRPPAQPGLNLGAAGKRYQHESAADQADALSMMGMSWLERGPIKQWVAAGFDAYHTMARNFARRKGNGVRFAAGKQATEEELGAAIAMHAATPFRKQFVYDADALNEFHSVERENPDVQLAQVLLTEDPHNIKLHLMREIDKNPRGERVGIYKALIGEINQSIGSDKAVRNEKGQTVGWKEPSSDALGMVRLKGARLLQEAHRRIENDLLKRGWLTHAGAQYVWDDMQKYRLDDFLKLLDMGQKKAEAILANGQGWEKKAARKWLEDIQEHRKNVEYAKAHWGDKGLQAVTERAARELDAQYDREVESGAALDYNDAYLPGRYDAEMHNNFSVFFAPRIAGRRYTQGKAYGNYYEAAADDMNVAATHDISNLVEHRVRQGMTALGKDNWQQSLSSVVDPTTGKRAYVMAKHVAGGRWVPDLKAGETEQDYEAVSSDGSRKPIFALAGSYERLMSQLVAPSAIQKTSLGQLAVKTSQALKHVALVGDVFHLARLSWYNAAINGRKGMNMWRGAHFIPGWAALDFDEKDLPAAQASGLLDQSEVKWLTEKIPFQVGKNKSQITRLQAARELEKVGYNVGQISDAIYKDVVRHVPVLGQYNNWLFDKFTRGIMMKSALNEFERIQKLEPDTSSEVVMRRVAHDLNRFFGSIGKQGWIKSNTFQDLSRIVFLSPQWVEGLISKEVSIPYKLATRLGTGDLKAVKDLMTGHESLARGVARGLLGMFVLTQVVNMITRGKPTWQNEKGHEWDADVGDNVWISPLSVFNEMTHELIKYGESKEKVWDALRQIGENKLGFIGRAALVGLTDTTPDGKYLTTTPAVVKAMAEQLAPTPVTAGPFFQEAGSVATGGRINPPRSADLRRMGAALAGVKADVGASPDSSLYASAQKFVKVNHLSTETEHHEQTDEPSYSQLRKELQLGNEEQARRVLDGMRKEGKSERQIIEGMSRWVASTFTGSRRNEVLWLRSLTPDEMAMYRQAVTGRRELYRKWLDFYSQDKQANTRP